MPKEKEIMRVARKGNFSAHRMGSELACNECGCYDWEGKHEDDCPLGALLEILKKEGIEE